MKAMLFRRATSFLIVVVRAGLMMATTMNEEIFYRGKRVMYFIDHDDV